MGNPVVALVVLLILALLLTAPVGYPYMPRGWSWRSYSPLATVGTILLVVLILYLLGVF